MARFTTTSRRVKLVDVEDTLERDEPFESSDDGDGVNALMRELAATPVFRSRDAVVAGTVLDERLRIEKRIGAGGMGVVFLAHHLRLEREVAVKLTHPGEAGSRSARLQREARAMARLTHENVVAVYDVGTVQGQVYIAMEYLDGGTAKQFVRAPGRTWQAILDLYLRAGEGLIAAHAANLVHRDFKPDNVLLGKDGRVRVADFGLVRGTDTASGELHSGSGSSLATSTQPSTSVPLTRTGATVGTPAYMAPEQHRGALADEASDQFAFCVSAWEGLYAERPFAGKSASELYLAIQQGSAPRPPAGSPVPRRIARVLARGLSFDRSDRYPSMRALLQALGGNAAKRRRQVLGAVAVLAVTAGGTYAVAAGAPEDPCITEASRLEPIWNPERAEAMEAAFVATEASFATDAFARTSGALENYASSWSDAARRACEATHVHRAQAPEALDLRLRCLSLRRAEFGALVAILAEPNLELISAAVGAVLKLPSLDACDDAEALARVEAVRPADAEAVAEIEEGLARASALHIAGRYAEIVPELDALGPRIEALGYEQLHARLELRRGLALARLGKVDDASATLRKGLEHAFAARHDTVVVELLENLAFVDGYRRGAVDQGRQWARLGLSWIRRNGDDAPARAEMLATQSLVEREGGEFAKAVRLTEESLAILAEYPSQARATTTSLAFLAEHYRVQGETTKAAAVHERVLPKMLALYGEEHPDYGRALINAGGIASGAGDIDRSQELTERGVAIRMAALGEADAIALEGRVNLGINMVVAGRADKGLEIVAETVKVAEKAGVADRTMFRLKNVLASILVENRRYEEGSKVAAEVAEQSSKVHGKGHVETLRAHINHASVLLTLGELEQARAVVDANFAYAQEGGDPMIVAFFYQTRARALRAVGNCRAAIADLESALQTLADVEGGYESLKTGPLALLGLCQLDLGERTAAEASLARLDALPEMQRGHEEPVSELRDRLNPE